MANKKMIDPYKIARKRVKQKKEFYQHLGIYIAVGLFFFAINIATFHGKVWFYFPMIPWGLGLVIHYLTIFGIPGLYDESPEWEARAVAEELERIKRHLPIEKVNISIEMEDDLTLKELQKEKQGNKNWNESELI